MFGDKKIQLPPQSTIAKMSEYHWPGNVRELQNVLKQIMILGEGEETIDDLLNTAGSQQRSQEFMATGPKPSIPVNLWRVNGEKVPNLSSLSLKKVRKKAQRKYLTSVTKPFSKRSKTLILIPLSQIITSSNSYPFTTFMAILSSNFKSPISVD
jgi:DNA-binding NtrC family response regulator